MSVADKLVSVQQSAQVARIRRLVSIRGMQFVMFVGALFVLAVPVAAQGGGGGGGGGGSSGIAYQIICGSNLGVLLSGLFTLLTLGLIATSVWRGGNGVRKMSDPRPKKKQEGREEAKGGMWALAGALGIGVAPQLFSSLGLTVFDCITFAGLV